MASSFPCVGCEGRSSCRNEKPIPLIGVSWGWLFEFKASLHEHPGLNTENSTQTVGLEMKKNPIANRHSRATQPMDPFGAWDDRDHPRQGLAGTKLTANLSGTIWGALPDVRATTLAANPSSFDASANAEARDSCKDRPQNHRKSRENLTP
jgi:hypothetical protein